MKLQNMILMAFAASLIFGCSSREQPISSEDVSREIKSAWDQYGIAMKTVNVDSVLAFWADDLKFITNKDDIDGKEAMGDFLTAIYNGLTIHEMNSVSTKLEVSGSLAVDVREYAETISYSEGEMQTLTGKQVTVWKKTDDGWKICIVAITPTTPDPVHEVF
jgi:ketosteroid isomerase-like protein